MWVIKRGWRIRGLSWAFHGAILVDGDVCGDLGDNLVGVGGGGSHEPGSDTENGRQSG